MTPDQALHLLDRAVASINAPRQDHLALQNAVNVIGAALRRAAELEAAATVKPETSDDA